MIRGQNAKKIKNEIKDKIKDELEPDDKMEQVCELNLKPGSHDSDGESDSEDENVQRPLPMYARERCDARYGDGTMFRLDENDVAERVPYDNSNNCNSTFQTV